MSLLLLMRTPVDAVQSLIVEDGTGLFNADSYISVADADLRHTNFGNTAWTVGTVTLAQKESALRKATAYMEQAYRMKWQGLPRKPRSGFASSDFLPQALSWPRWDVWVDQYPVDPDSVPAEVKNACADLALRALTGDLNADLTQKVVREGVGSLATAYDPNSPQHVRYRAIDMMLAPFLVTTSGNVRLMRA